MAFRFAFHNTGKYFPRCPDGGHSHGTRSVGSISGYNLRCLYPLSIDLDSSRNISYYTKLATSSNT